MAEVIHSIETTNRPETLFELLVRDDLVPHWTRAHSATVEAREGGAYDLTWHIDDRSWRGAGRILTLAPPDSLVVELHGPDNWRSAVEFRVAPTADGAELAVTHRDLDDQQAESFRALWVSWLEALDSVATAAGVDEAVGFDASAGLGATPRSINIGPSTSPRFVTTQPDGSPRAVTIGADPMLAPPDPTSLRWIDPGPAFPM